MSNSHTKLELHQHQAQIPFLLSVQVPSNMADWLIQDFNKTSQDFRRIFVPAAAMFGIDLLHDKGIKSLSQAKPK